MQQIAFLVLLGPLGSWEVSLFVKYFCKYYWVSEEVCSCETLVSIIRSIKPFFNLSIRFFYRKRYYFLILFDSLKHQEFTVRLSMMHMDVFPCVQSCLLLCFPSYLFPLDLIQVKSNAKICPRAQVKLKATEINHKRNFCTCKMRRGLGGCR